MAYSISHPPHPELCDCYSLPLSDDNSIVYICGHSYHDACYNKKYLDDDENDVEEGANEVSEEIEKALDTLSRLVAEIYEIEHW
ncbi:hypothetical protein C2G38_2159422 [Gigaspora rosea]|uniref:Uncharacterized protein n=1 Tax=Gigaspora rosea TaxID=44941 RepID=A0A397W1E0_9GLOM|nr:hypothetical protein C2G38_2159422 [Gigaspora rosea]